MPSSHTVQMKHCFGGNRANPGGIMLSSKRIFTIAAVSACAFVLSACAPDPSTSVDNDNDTSNIVANKITGSVGDWYVDVSASKAKAGEVVFAIANFGTVQHEFLVTKTSYEPGKIPIGENNRFDEDDPGIEVIDEIKEWPVNEAKVLTLDLEPGQYELLCNIESHYGLGMWHSFEVLPGE